MKSFDSDLKKYTEKTRLKAAERRELRERVLSYMEYHPLPKQRSEVLQHTLSGDRFIFIPLNTVYTRVAAGFFALVLFVGVPLIAERAVPGDALYLVKTEVNEGIRSQFADSPYEKVELETKLIERRIAEARLLASEGKLTDEVQAEIALTVKGHASAAQSGIAELRANDADEAAIAEIAFSSALEVQAAVLDTQIETSTSSSVAIIQEVVDTARETVVANKPDTAPSFDKLMAKVESETTRAYELLVSIKESATEEEQTDIERRLSDIDRKIVRAKEMHLAPVTEGENGVAELASGLGLIQKLIVFMTDIDVRETVALETLVPVELTVEERVDAARTLFNDITAREARITPRVDRITDANLLEKVALGMDSLDALLVNATSTLDTGDIDAVEPRLKEALTLVDDLDRMTIEYEVHESVVVPVTDTASSTTEETVDFADEGTTTPEAEVEQVESGEIE